MTEQEASDLLRKFNDGQCTPEELSLLNSWYNHLEGITPAPGKINYLLAEERIWNKVVVKTYRSTKLNNAAKRLAVAATILLIGLVVYFYYQHFATESPAVAKLINDAAPGEKAAFLTISNGVKLNLEEIKTGTTELKDGVAITKTATGEITYSANGATSPLINHTISTPRGGEYQVKLPDGSKVWLNAASSITYPISFNEREEVKVRKISMTGEAYFEVAKDPDRPFIVVTPTQEVKVLGTHFNINAYTDENAVVTTLLEGSVLVRSAKLNYEARLSPGQQAITIANQAIQVAQASPNAIAWKEGKLKFTGTDLPSLMRQVSRWYNIDVQFEGPIPNKQFSGGIARNTNLSTLLKILELSHIKFKLIEGPGGKKLLVKN